MKRILLVLSVLFVCFAIVSCNKESVDEGLTQTSWVSHQTGVDGYPMDLYLMFLSNRKCTLGNMRKFIEGTYEYNAPNVTMTFTPEGETGKLYGQISGNVMNVSDGSQYLTFYRQ